MDLPLEIVCNIYAHAELETCVNLREVNSYWYAAFNQLDVRLLRDKVKERNPWLKPGEDGTGLKTWSECLRVFVARVRCDKWIAVECLKDIEYPSELTEEIPLELTSVETTLPKDYQPLMKMQRPEYNTMMKLYDNYYLDLHTLEARISPPANNAHALSFPEVLEETDEIAVCDCSGVKVVVPKEMATIETQYHINEHMVVVFNPELVWILPREYPDYRQGRGWSRPGSRKVYQMGHQNLTSGYTFVVENNYISPIPQPMLLVVDMENQRTLHIPEMRDDNFGDPHVENVAPESVVQIHSIYNGLLWIVDYSPEGYMGFFSLLIDLKDIPEADGSGTTRVNKMYYRKDRIVLFEQYMGSISSCIPLGAQRYVLFLDSTFDHRGNRLDALFIVDLATWKVWMIAEDFREDEGTLAMIGQELFVGFSEGKLGAWMYDNDTVEMYNRRLQLAKMLRPRRTTYDLSRDRKMEDDFEVQRQ